MKTIFLNRRLSILIILAVVLMPYAAMSKNPPESLQDKIKKAYPPGTIVIAKKAISGRISAGDVLDIYALGVTLYKMLTGRLPYEGDVESIMARDLTIIYKGPITYDADRELMDFISETSRRFQILHSL